MGFIEADFRIFPHVARRGVLFYSQGSSEFKFQSLTTEHCSGKKLLSLLFKVG